MPALLAHFRGPRAVHVDLVVDADECAPHKIDALLHGRFEFNGETHALPDPIDWLANPSADVEWHILLHKFYYAAGLGQAFRRSGDARYARALGRADRRLDARHAAGLHRRRRDRAARAELDLQPAPFVNHARRARGAGGAGVPAPPAAVAARAGRVPVREPHAQAQPPHARAVRDLPGRRGVSRDGARRALARVRAARNARQPARRPAGRRRALRAVHRLPPPRAAQLAARAHAGRAQRRGGARRDGRSCSSARSNSACTCTSPTASCRACPMATRAASCAAGAGRRAVRPRRHALRRHARRAGHARRGPRSRTSPPAATQCCAAAGAPGRTTSTSRSTWCSTAARSAKATTATSTA